MIIIISFSNVSFENACEHYVKCYPKGYARSVQTKDGPLCTFMHGNYMVYTTHNGCVLYTKLSVG